MTAKAEIPAEPVKFVALPAKPLVVTRINETISVGATLVNIADEIHHLSTTWPVAHSLDGPRAACEEVEAILRDAAHELALGHYHHPAV